MYRKLKRVRAPLALSVLAALLGAASAAAQPAEPGGQAAPPARRAAPKPPPAPPAADDDSPGKNPAPPAADQKPGRPPRQQRQLVPARFEATVFEVQVAPDKLAALDAATLRARAATAADLDKALRELGETHVLYRVDQVVNAADHGQISVVSDAPFVSGKSAPASGQIQTAVSRQSVGVRFEFDALPPEPGDAGRGSLDLRIELSGYNQSRIEVSDGVTAPIFRKATQLYAGPIDPSKPIVLISFDGAPSLAAPLAYVTRIVVSPQ